MQSEVGFPHQRLDAYRVAVELACTIDHLTDPLPAAYSKVGDNLRRSSQGVPLLIGEGANRYTRAQKRQRFIEARGEVGECAAAIELCIALGAIAEPDAGAALVLCDRVGAMLTRLIQRLT